MRPLFVAVETVTFYFKFGDAGALLPLVENGRLDLALVDEFLTRNQVIGNLDIYHFAPVVEEEVILASSIRYYLESVKENTSFENLSRQDYIAYRHNAQTVKKMMGF